MGVNYGLILTTNNEAQLASVLAHESAHVTQRHIARGVKAQGRQSIASAAAILGRDLARRHYRRQRRRGTRRDRHFPRAALQSRINFTRQ
ncbi:MAG: M48 family metalloprotease [Proteobacteria bacterium]|nr:M48 family metalloprotease [Pseudomonadota bacterium]